MLTSKQKRSVPNGLRRLPPQLARQALLRIAGRRRIFERGESAERIYLTFDDGPHPEYTPSLLDLLAQAQSRATFFVVGQACERYPELLQRIVDEGHAVGNHSYFHHSPGLVTASQLKAEVIKTRDAIKRISGRETSLFRPPYGALTLSKIAMLWGSGYQVALWNVDPKDYSSTPAEVADWFASHPLQGQDVVLLHDVHAAAAAALPTVLEDLRRRGLSSAALPA